MNEPDRFTMEEQLYRSGYGREFIEYLTDNLIRHLYYDEFGTTEK